MNTLPPASKISPEVPKGSRREKVVEILNEYVEGKYQR